MSSKDYGVITSVDQLSRLADKLLADGKPVGFDVETGYYGPDFPRRALDHYNSNQFTVGFSLSNDPSWARYIPLRHDGDGNIDDPTGAWEAVRELLTKGTIVAHNSKMERAAVDKAAGIKLASEGQIIDTMLSAYVLGEYYNKSWRTIVALKDLVEEIYGHKMTHLNELLPDYADSKMKFFRFNTLELTPKVWEYACEDAAWVLPLEKDVAREAYAKCHDMYIIEHKIAEMMYEVEQYGVTIDWSAIEAAQAEGDQFVPLMEQFVKHELGRFAERDLTATNLNSAAQIKRLLFHDMGLVTTRLTKKGQSDEASDLEDWERMSTDAKSLTALAKENLGVKALLEFREVKNLKNRLDKWLKEYRVCDDGRVHANYNQTVVPSGRFSANDPAIQQLPKEPWLWVADKVDFEFDLEKQPEKTQAYIDSHTNATEFWKGKFRNFIVSAPDHYLITFDFSQAELRVLAGVSQEPALLEAFANGVDVHTATAATMFGLQPAEVTGKDRAKGKTLNFGLLYGQGPKALGEQLGVEFEEAKALYQQYFSAFTNVNSWYNDAKRKGHKDGFVTSVFNRRIPIWELLGPTNAIKSKGDRVIINSQIQGAVADYVKFVMLQTRKKLIKEGLWNNGVMMTMNHHDALTFEVHNSIDPNYIRDMLSPLVVMNPETFPPLKGFPPFVADWELGLNWGSSTKWGLNQKAEFVDGQWKVMPEPQLASFTVHLGSNPTETAFRDFISSIKKSHGDTIVSLFLPDGEVKIPFTAKVTESSSIKLKNLFNDAKIEYSY